MTGKDHPAPLRQGFGRHPCAGGELYKEESYYLDVRSAFGLRGTRKRSNVASSFPLTRCRIESDHDKGY
jgi:hypothetical protein